jgi:outer membrane protein assembly factor BamB
VRTGAAILAAAAMAFCAAPRGSSWDWPCWGGPDGTGASREADWDGGALAGGARVAWTADVGAGYSNVSISSGRLFTAGLKDGESTVFCLDAATGETVWAAPYDDAALPQSTPAVDGERVCALGAQGLLLCLDARDGRVIWERDMARGLGLPLPKYTWAASPSFDGERLLVNGGGAFLALDTADGAELWRAADGGTAGGGASYASALVSAAGGRRTAVFVGSRRLTAVDAATGEIFWAFPHGNTSDAIAANPIAVGEGVFCALASTCGLTGLDDGGPVWKSQALTTSLSGPVLVDGMLFGCALPPSLSFASWKALERKALVLRCVDAGSGRIAWEKPMKHVSVGAAGPRLLLLEMSGTLRIAEASPDGYRELGSADVLKGAQRPRNFVTPPVLCNGRIYCRNTFGDLVCIDAGRR